MEKDILVGGALRTLHVARVGEIDLYMIQAHTCIATISHIAIQWATLIGLLCISYIIHCSYQICTSCNLIGQQPWINQGWI